MFDGATRQREKKAGIAIVLKDELERSQIREKMFVHPATSNEAEYKALILGLEVALEQGVSALQVLGDSRLIIEQILGPYACKAENLKPLHARATELLQEFGQVAIRHVKREFNVEADALAPEALAQGLLATQTIGRIKEDGASVNQVAVEDPGPWYSQLWDVLLFNKYPEGATAQMQARLKCQSAPFTMVDGVLYHMGVNKVLRRCVAGAEIPCILFEAHTSVCGGGHFDGKMTGLKILRAGYY